MIEQFAATLPLVLLLFPLGGCADSDAQSAPSAIVCQTHYRPDAETDAGALDDRVTVTKKRTETSTATIDFPHGVLTVSYSDRIDERSISVVLTDSAGHELARVLYQLPFAIQSEIPGGHGFTGLHYVRMDRAQLQWWCGEHE